MKIYPERYNITQSGIATSALTGIWRCLQR